MQVVPAVPTPERARDLEGAGDEEEQRGAARDMSALVTGCLYAQESRAGVASPLRFCAR